MEEDDLTKLLNWFEQLKAKIKKLEFDVETKKTKLESLCDIRYELEDIIKNGRLL